MFARFGAMSISPFSSGISVDPLPMFISPLLNPEWLDSCPPRGQALRLGVLASGTGSNFVAIAQAIAQKRLNAQIQVLVYNNPGAKVGDRADEWGVTKVLCDHREFREREGCDRRILEVLQAHQVEWVIMAGWMRVVTPILIDAFPGRMVNIHPSLLPSFPGTRGVENALKQGVKVTGCTVHLVTLAVDQGPILMQAAVPILPDDSKETLLERIHAQEHCIFPQAIALAATLEQTHNTPDA